MALWLQRLIWGAGGVPGGDRARRDLGARGEREAVRHLRGQGMRIVAKNVVSRAGEIDLVCVEPSGVVVVVEVKTRMVRSGVRAPRAERSVTSAKRRKLVRLAGAYARREGIDRRRIRIDVVAVEFDDAGRATVRHHRRAVTTAPRRG